MISSRHVALSITPLLTPQIIYIKTHVDLERSMSLSTRNMERVTSRHKTNNCSTTVLAMLMDCTRMSGIIIKRKSIFSSQFYRVLSRMGMNQVP